MPCDQIRLCQVQLTDQTDKTLLNQAILTLTDGRAPMMEKNGDLRFFVGRNLVKLTKDNLIISFDASVADKIKVAYSALAVKKAAARFGWSLTKTKENAYVASKRG